jgi:hypothetical protein
VKFSGGLRVEGIERIEAAHESQVRAEEEHRLGVAVKVRVGVEAETGGVEAEDGTGIEEEGREGREGGEEEGGGSEKVEAGRAENAADDERGDNEGVDDFLV